MSLVDGEQLKLYLSTLHMARQLRALSTILVAVPQQGAPLEAQEDRPKRVSSRTSKKSKPAAVQADRFYLKLDAEGALALSTEGEAKTVVDAINSKLAALIRPHVQSEIDILLAFAAGKFIERTIVDAAIIDVRNANNVHYILNGTLFARHPEGLVLFKGKGADVRALRLQGQIDNMLYEFSRERLTQVMADLNEIAQKL